MPSDRAKPSDGWIKLKWRLLAVILAAVLLIATFVGILMTAPISEMLVVVRNWETDTVRITMRLDDSGYATAFYVDGGQSTDQLLHVSPGTHSIGFMFTYDAYHNETVDFLWTTHVGFNGLNPVFLDVEREGFTQNHLYDHLTSDHTPAGEAIRDPNVLVPAVMLAASTIFLVAAIWNFRWRRPK